MTNALAALWVAVVFGFIGSGFFGCALEWFGAPHWISISVMVILTPWFLVIWFWKDRKARGPVEHPHPFTGSDANEAQFQRALTPEEKELYRAAVAERRELARRFHHMLQQTK